MSQITPSGSDIFERESFHDDLSGYKGLYSWKPIGGLRARYLLDRNLRDHAHGLSGERRHYDEGELTSGRWLYIVENEFARKYFNVIDQRRALHRRPAAVATCRECYSFHILSRLPQTKIEELTIDVMRLKEVESSCDLCRFLLRCLNRYRRCTEDNIKIFRHGSVFQLEEYDLPILTVLADPSMAYRFMREAGRLIHKQASNPSITISRLVFLLCHMQGVGRTLSCFVHGLAYATIITNDTNVIRKSKAYSPLECLTWAKEDTQILYACIAPKPTNEDHMLPYHTAGASPQVNNKRIFAPYKTTSTSGAKV